MAYRSLLTLILITQPVLLLQTGCDHYEPLEARTDIMQEGPGLFSGEKGYFDLTQGLHLNTNSSIGVSKPPEESYNPRRPLDTNLSDEMEPSGK